MYVTLQYCNAEAYKMAANTWRRSSYRRLSTRLECVRQTALSTVQAVLVRGHLTHWTINKVVKKSEGKYTYEDTCTAGSGWAVATETLDFAIRFYLVILQDGHLDFLALMFDLFRGLRARHSSVKR
jgi:hypothetical protein